MVLPDMSALTATETDRVEWKQSGKDAAEVLQAVCALANDLGDSQTPGYLVLGLDKRGRAVGADVSDDAQQQLANRLSSTKILPHPSCSIATVTHEGAGLLVVEVQPYPVPPVVKVDGVAWVRLGTVTQRAREADLLRLDERRPEVRQPFDLRRALEASLDDLNLTALHNRYEAVRQDDADPDTFPGLERWLKQENVARLDAAGRFVPTHAGLLVYGRDPQAFLPGAVVELARYAGPELDAPVVFRKTIAGALTDQLDALWSQLAGLVVEVPDASDSEGIRERFAPTYPEEALKEFARNLVQHRAYDAVNAPSRVSWFEDKVVFSNPGGPFGQAALGAFGAQSDYRNPMITAHLVKLGYVQRLGRGIGAARAQLARNGNPPFEVETDGFTTITVRRRP